MDEDQKELTTEESIKQVMQTLPPVVRAYLSQGKYTEIAKNLIVKYNLHPDQGSILEREIMLLLMGIEDPDEFTQTLVGEAQLDEKNVDSIVQDINTEIFLPLQEQMKGESEKLTKPTMPPASWKESVPPPPRPQQINATVPSYAPSSLAGAGSVSGPRPAPQSVAPVQKVAQVISMPVQNEKLLEDREEPHIEFNKTSVPPNLPGVMPQPVISETKPPATIPTINPPIQKPVQPPVQIPSIKSYSVDPYREPIDEEGESI